MVSYFSPKISSPTPASTNRYGSKDYGYMKTFPYRWIHTEERKDKQLNARCQYQATPHINTSFE